MEKMRIMSRKACVATGLLQLLLCGFPLVGNAKTLYVSPNGNNSDGLTPEKAYHNPHDAIVAAADGDEIKVAMGTYKPTTMISGGTTIIDKTFYINKSISLIGGYNPNNFSQSNSNTWPTVLSGDFDDNDTYDADGYPLVVGSNADHIITIAASSGKTVVVRGFTFKNGSATSSGTVISGATFPRNSGGAIIVSNIGGSVTINDNHFTCNAAFYVGNAIHFFGNATATNKVSDNTFQLNWGNGAAISCNNVKVDFSNNTIAKNKVANSANRGAGVYVSGTSAAVTFTGDSIAYNTSLSNGAGIYQAAGKLTLTDVVFTYNVSGGTGGAMHADAGSITINRCRFIGNSATNGAGIAVPNLNVTKVIIDSSRFIENTASSWGGAIWHEGQSLTVTRSSFDSNSAVGGGAILHDQGRFEELSGSVFTNNDGTTNHGGAIYIYAGTYGSIKNNTFTGNKTSSAVGYWGGAIYSAVAGAESTPITNNVFTSNEAPYGGAIFTSNSTWITSNKFIGNRGTADGGAVFVRGTSYITANLFEKNTSARDAGAVFDDGTTTYLHYNTFIANKSANRSGVVEPSGGGLYLRYNTMVGNQAKIGGVLNGGTVYMYNNTMVGNYASEKGGATAYGPNHYMGGNIIVGNYAKTGGQPAGQDVESCHASSNYNVFSVYPASSNMSANDILVDCSGANILEGSYNNNLFEPTLTTHKDGWGVPVTVVREQGLMDIMNDIPAAYLSTTTGTGAKPWGVLYKTAYNDQARQVINTSTTYNRGSVMAEAECPMVVNKSWYVNPNIKVPGNGSTPNGAVPHFDMIMRSACYSATDTIKMAKGNYHTTVRPNAIGATDPLFPITKAVILKGGYNGAFTQWIPSEYVSLFSGDVNNNDIYDANYTTISNYTDNKRIVDVTPGDADKVYLSGITIRGGYWNGGSGPGIRHNKGILTIDSVTLNLNRAPSAGTGAGMYSIGKSLSVYRSTLSYNESSWGGAAIHADRADYGGAVKCIIGTTFIGNQADNGGAMFIKKPWDSIQYCSFINNTASNYGGAIFFQWAPSTNGYHNMKGNMFKGNSAKMATLYTEHNLYLMGNTFDSCQVADNNGAIVLTTTDQKTIYLHSNTFKNNGSRALRSDAANTPAELRFNTFTGNIYSGTDAAGIIQISGATKLFNNTIVGNHVATANGSAVYIAKGVTEFYGNIISGNTGGNTNTQSDVRINGGKVNASNSNVYSKNGVVGTLTGSINDKYLSIDSLPYILKGTLNGKRFVAELQNFGCDLCTDATVVNFKNKRYLEDIPYANLSGNPAWGISEGGVYYDQTRNAIPAIKPYYLRGSVTKCCPEAHTWYINIGNSTNGEGTSPADASQNLSGIMSSGCLIPGDSLLVAEGIYTPDPLFNLGSNRDASFFVDMGITMWGGYNGSFTQRTTDNSKTVLSADLNGNDSYDANGNITSGADENAYHIMAVNIVAGDSAHVDGFTFRGGNANEVGSLAFNGITFDRNKGGAITAVAEATNAFKIKLSNVRMHGNQTAADGAAMYVDKATLDLQRSTIDHNTTSGSGALYTNNANSALKYNTFANNTSAGNGGAAVVNAGATQWHFNTMVGNKAAAQGGAIKLDNAKADLFNNTLSGNNANTGGAIYHVGASGKPLYMGGNIALGNRAATGNDFNSASFQASQDKLEYNLLASGGNTYGTGDTIRMANGKAQLIFRGTYSSSDSLFTPVLDAAGWGVQVARMSPMAYKFLNKIPATNLTTWGVKDNGKYYDQAKQEITENPYSIGSVRMLNYGSVPAGELGGPLVLDSFTVAGKIYDNNDTARIASYGTLLTVFEGDDVRIDTTQAIALFDNRNAGVNKEATAVNIKLVGTHSEAYELVMPKATATITPKALSVRRE